MKMSFTNSPSESDYKLVLDVTDAYDLDKGATLHFTFYNGTTAIEPYTEVFLPACGIVRQIDINCSPTYTAFTNCASAIHTISGQRWRIWKKAQPASGSYTLDSCVNPPVYDSQKNYYRQEVNFKKGDNANCYGPQTRTEFSESGNNDLLIAHGCSS